MEIRPKRDLNPCWAELQNAHKGFVEDLLVQIAKHEERAERSREETQAQKRLIRDFKKEIEHLKRQLASQAGGSQGVENKIVKQNEDRFVAILIDGNSARFLDKLVQKRKMGGRKAARVLRNRIQRHVKGRIDFRDERIIILVFCDVEKLTRIYRTDGDFNQEQNFERFRRGFNKVSDIMDIVNIKQGAADGDTKIYELFRAIHSDVQCKHIVLFAPYHDGSKRLMAEFSIDEEARDRMTLVETPHSIDRLMPTNS